MCMCMTTYLSLFTHCVSECLERASVHVEDTSITSMEDTSISRVTKSLIIPNASSTLAGVHTFVGVGCVILQYKYARKGDQAALLC